MSISMRQQFTKTMEYLENHDERVILLLNDIGVWAFRNLKEQYPNRVHNLGILEQASIGVAAGLSLVGFIPFFHTIAPFIVERGYEQLKDDFGYQNINGNFVSVGASFDYSGLGTTHYCPGDVGALMQIPNIQIILPGTAFEEDMLIKSAYNNESPTYYRLSEQSNTDEQEVIFGRANVIKRGTKATVIAVGTMLDKVINATKDLDITILYYTTIKPFDLDTLIKVAPNEKILLCEPYYYGALTNEILKAFSGKSVNIDFVGVPHEILHTYGSVKENEKYLGMTEKEIRSKLSKLMEE